MEEQLKIILNSLDEAILSLTKEGEIRFLNTAAARLFGVGDAARHPAGVLTDFVQRLNLDQLSSELGSKFARRVEFRNGTGTLLSLEVQMTRALVAGRPLFLVVIPDPGLQAQVAGALYQARRTQGLGALAGGIAQDFNNVLTAILSQVDLALSSSDLQAPGHEHLTSIKASARRGAELVQRLQAFEGQSRPRPASLELPHLLEQVVFVLRRSIDPRIEIHSPPAPAPLWSVRVDPVALMDVLLNSVLNARDVMKEGRVTIETGNASFTAPVVAPRKAGEFVRVSVRATVQDKNGVSPRAAGPWLPAEEWDKAAALGLSLIDRVMAEQGGWMEVEQGDTGERLVHLFLPRASEKARAALPPAGPRRETKPVGGKERILLVDDEEMVRMVVRAILVHCGYQVVEAEDGEQAVAKYQQSSGYDLVMIDLNMPRLNGREALLRIRKHDPGVRAILLSGGVDERDSDRMRQLEGVEFLQKPFENQELLRLVRSTLDAGPLPRP